MPRRLYNGLVWLVLVSPTRMIDAKQNPYSVLGVTRTSLQDEIKLNYRKLCLRHHPDKHHTSKTKQQNEQRFKEVQHAYDQIGSPEARRRYDQTAAGSFFASRSENSSFWKKPSTDPSAREFFSFRDPFGPASYSTGSFFFSARDPLFDRQERQAKDLFEEVWRNHASRNRGVPFFANVRGQPMKSIYKQSVQVELEDLYNGKKNYEMRLNNFVVWDRILAAFRGNLGYMYLYGSLLYALPFLKLSKVVALLWGSFIFWSSLPTASTYYYKVDLRSGYKAGTKIKFDGASATGDSRVKVLFLLKEARHKLYSRKGNDLITTINVSKRQAQDGCLVDLLFLDGEHVKVSVPRETESGDTIRIRSKGWPIRQGGGYGDLIVTVDVQRR